MTSPFPDRLRLARERADLSQVARISRYETGKMQPTFETIADLARVLRVPQAFFFCETEAQACAVLEASR